MSLSARRAWIEIQRTSHDSPAPKVALRKESVDRNNVRSIRKGTASVALRKESVDRNSCCSCCSVRLLASLSARRAWIEITTYLDTSSMDESLSARRAWIEIVQNRGDKVRLKSLSARRAWIEILASWSAVLTELVALRKESVDRNNLVASYLMRQLLSLSARRAWIEIFKPSNQLGDGFGRSPQGERG